MMDVFGHTLQPPVEGFVDELLTFGRPIRIQSMAVMRQEMGQSGPPPEGVPGLARPQVDNLAAIWIDTALPDDTFNAVLAEELLHHIDAQLGIQAISCIDPLCFPSVAAARGYIRRLNSVLMDFRAFHRMHEAGVFGPRRTLEAQGAAEIAAAEADRIAAHQYLLRTEWCYELVRMALQYFALARLGDATSGVVFSDLWGRLLSEADYDECWQLLEQLGLDVVANAGIITSVLPNGPQPSYLELPLSGQPLFPSATATAVEIPVPT